MEECVPAVGQGIIGIECRADDERSIRLVAALNDRSAWQCGEAERAFARRLQGSCQSPIAAHAQLDGGQLRLTGVVGAPEGGEMYRDTHSGDVADAQPTGTAPAARLVEAGAGQLLARLR